MVLAIEVKTLRNDLRFPALVRVRGSDDAVIFGGDSIWVLGIELKTLHSNLRFTALVEEIRAHIVQHKPEAVARTSI